jgi:hypothetical protein
MNHTPKRPQTGPFFLVRTNIVRTVAKRTVRLLYQKYFTGLSFDVVRLSYKARRGLTSRVFLPVTGSNRPKLLSSQYRVSTYQQHLRLIQKSLPQNFSNRQPA